MSESSSSERNPVEGPDKRLLAVGSSGGSLVIWNIPKVRSRLAEIGLDW